MDLGLPDRDDFGTDGAVTGLPSGSDAQLCPRTGGNRGENAVDFDCLAGILVTQKERE